MKVSFKIGQYVTGTGAAIKDAKDCAVRAHNRIDEINQSLKEA